MIAWLAPAYLWLKAFHIVAVIAWMAGLLYLPRLYVYHAEVEPNGAQSAVFKAMERRLLRAIMNPAMIVVWILGVLVLLSLPKATLHQGWLHAKLALVVVLTVYHHLLARWRKAFEMDSNRRPARFYRRVNEIPFAILIAIVLLVVLKPF